MLQAERSEGPEPGDHTLISEVAERQMKTSLLKSLQKSTPETYMICLHLNLHKQLQIQLKFRGLNAKCTSWIFEKVQMMKKVITMQLLVQNYPRIIYDMAICK